MKLVTNHISTGKQKSFRELVSEIQGKNQQVKTASANVEAKGPGSKSGANEDEAESSGQLDVEPLHQKGESEHPDPTKMPKDKEANAEVAKEADCKDTDNENNSEADDSLQPTWEGKQENNNNPEAGKHRDGDGDQEKAASTKKSKEAQISNFGDKKAKPFGSKGDDDKKDMSAADADGADDDDKDVEAKVSSKTKVAGCNCGCGDCPSCDCENCGGEHSASAKTEAKVAKKEANFVKVSNLDEKSKSWLDTYWKNLYPSAFVDAMLADK